MGGIQGGVHPLEWILPPLAASHLAVDAAVRAADSDNAQNTPNVPGSYADQAIDEQKDTEKKNQEQLAQAQRDADARLALEPKPETAQDVTASRQRAIAASEALGGQRKRRASQTLTDPGRLLSGSAAGSYGP